MNAITKAEPNIAREGFGSRELEQRHETASTAVAAQARAEIEAAYIMALQRPRDWDDVRTKLLKECARTGFAERAYFAVPRGDKPGRITGQMNETGYGGRGLIEGLSIRFVEAALRCAGNVSCPSQTVYDDDVKRIVRVSVVDLESNLRYPKDIVIEKTVERRKTKDKDRVLGERTNSAGETVFIVASTDDELLMKENNLTSKALRTLGLRLIPADILEEAEQKIAQVVKADVEQDPTAARKKIADAFASLGVLPSQLAEYLGHALDACSPAELQMLGGLFRAIRDNEVTWAEVVSTITKPGDAPEAKDEKKTAAQKVAEKVKARMPKADAAPAAATTTTAPAPAPADAGAPAPPAQDAGPPPRDWAAETARLKEDITAAVGDTKAMAEVRKRFAVYAKEAPAEHGEELQRYLVMVSGEKKKAREPGED